MKKREFIKKSTLLTLGVMATPVISCVDTGNKQAADKTPTGKEANNANAADKASIFTLPALPYALDALQPNIDAETMGIHHGKHHAGYVRKLNAALENNATFAGKNLNEIVSSVGENDTAVRNNGGGHYNHSLFWEVMKPGGGNAPSGKLAEAINAGFSSYDKFKETFSTAAATRFGSGWAWLSADANGKLFVSSTPNQDNPMMKNLVEQVGTPILGIDIWEHAYYLFYQNRRKDYINNFFNIINWEKVAENYANV